MIRGRRVIGVVFVLLASLLLAAQVHAAELSMSASVPLSPLWKELIAKHSVFTLDTHSHRNIAELTGQIKGADNVILPPQTVQALLFEGDALADNQIKKTDMKDNISFTFVYKRGAAYRIILVGSPDDSPYVIDFRQF